MGGVVEGTGEAFAVFGAHVERGHASGLGDDAGAADLRAGSKGLGGRAVLVEPLGKGGAAGDGAATAVGKLAIGPIDRAGRGAGAAVVEIFRVGGERQAERGDDLIDLRLGQRLALLLVEHEQQRAAVADEIDDGRTLLGADFPRGCAKVEEADARGG